MRLYGTDLQLTYCSNVHAARNADELFANLRYFAGSLKQRLSPAGLFGVGLHIPNEVARELVYGRKTSQLADVLAQNGLELTTLNGFPFTVFQGGKIKSAVFAPDWTDSRRLEYTQLLVTILAAAVPEGTEIGISTLPLSLKAWTKDSGTVFEQSTELLIGLVANLAEIAAVTGRIIHIDIEPEPGGTVETSAELAAFFERWLIARGRGLLRRRTGMTSSSAEAHIRRHIRVCYDACHFAIEFEEPRHAFQRFASVGMAVGKVQLSSALRVVLPGNLAMRAEIRRRLREFAESTYLHQVLERSIFGEVRYLGDLDEALTTLDTTTAQEWRIHYHVPLFFRDFGMIQSTQRHVGAAIHEAIRREITQVFEIETYTWDVLPVGLRLPLLDSIEREYRWVLDHMEGVQFAERRKAA